MYHMHNTNKFILAIMTSARPNSIFIDFIFMQPLKSLKVFLSQPQQLILFLFFHCSVYVILCHYQSRLSLLLLLIIFLFYKWIYMTPLLSTALTHTLHLLYMCCSFSAKNQSTRSKMEGLKMKNCALRGCRDTLNTYATHTTHNTHHTHNTHT